MHRIVEASAAVALVDALASHALDLPQLVTLGIALDYFLCMHSVPIVGVYPSFARSTPEQRAKVLAFRMHLRLQVHKLTGRMSPAEYALPLHAVLDKLFGHHKHAVRTTQLNEASPFTCDGVCRLLDSVNDGKLSAPLRASAYMVAKHWLTSRADATPCEQSLVIQRAAVLRGALRRNYGLMHDDCAEEILEMLAAPYPYLASNLDRDVRRSMHV